MNNLIDIYVNEVVKRMPEKDREEVKRELVANIYDMLPEDAEENQVVEVLNQLGSPKELAKGYLKTPRHLISPELYDNYIETLKKVVPWVAAICVVVAVVIAIINSATITSVDDAVVIIKNVIKEIIKQVFVVGFSGAFQATVWITVGFIIADRVGYKSEIVAKKWTVDDLPKAIPNEKYSINLSDSIVELVLTVVFSVLFFLFISGMTPSLFILLVNDVKIINPFTNEFLWSIGYCVIATGIMTIIESTIKIVVRKWTPAVCCAVVASGVVSIISSVYVLTRTNVFNSDFLGYLSTASWNKFDLLRFFNEANINPVILVIMLIVIVVTIVEVIYAVIKTVKATAIEREYGR